ncbi:hypothetical protein QQ054_14940 [Oscillatoria amoena NRMC-F 0135]|nr:hypothetical protein [Oscillatoria amoena NRMC-F 0135]
MGYFFNRKAAQHPLAAVPLDTHSLPNADEARRDGRTGLDPKLALSLIMVFFAVALDATCRAIRNFISEKTTELVHARVREAKALDRVDRIGEPVDNIILAILFLVMAVFCADGEGRMLQGLAAVFASGYTKYAYETGLVIALVGAGLLKLAISKSRIAQSVTAHRGTRILVAVIGFLLVVATALIRPRFMETVEASLTNNHQLGKLLVENSGAILLMFVAYSLGLWLMSALALERAMQVLDAHVAAWRYERIRKRRERLERDIAVAETSLAGAKDSFDRAMELKIAEYEYEYELGRLGDKTATDSEVFTGFLKFASTAAASVLAGGVSGAIAYVVTKSPMPAVVAGSVVALLAGGAMTWFNRGGGSVLAVIALLGASFLNGGCRASGPSPQGVALVIDTSKSVRMTDEQRISAVRGVVPRLGRCTQLLIMPVNAEAGDSYAMSIPCEGVIFDADIKNAVEALNQQLPKKLAEWRGKGDRSDYRWTMRQAVEAVKPFNKRTVIFIGDMVDDRDTHPASTLPGVPDLPREGLRGTTVYLGWAQSSVLDRLPDRQRDQFQERWKYALENVGAFVVSNAFGLQGLDGFAECRFSSSTSCPTAGEVKP